MPLSAGLCKACATVEAKDPSLANLTDPVMYDQAGHATFVYCGGCGYIQVDPEGWCLTPHCLRASEMGHGGKRIVQVAPRPPLEDDEP